MRRPITVLADDRIAIRCGMPGGDPTEMRWCGRPFKNLWRMNTEQGRAGAEIVARYVR
jgi:hypothetical protein